MGEQSTDKPDGDCDDGLPSNRDTKELVERYQNLVYKVAHRVQHQLPHEVPIEDLVGWGYTGLLQAHQRYDPSKSTRFATYAYYRIRGAILDACKEPLLDPHRQRTTTCCNEVLNTFAHVVQSQQGAVSLEDRLSMLSDVAGSLMMVFVLRDSPERALGPQGAPHRRSLERRQIAEKTRSVVDRLPDTERKVIVGIYFRDQSMTEVAEEHGYSPSWVSRVHTRALEKLERLIDDEDELDDLRHALPV